MFGKMLTHRAKILLLLIAALTAFLTYYQIAAVGDGNQYYTAAVKSMLTSWHNFFYGSFDSGFISVDKPAPGLWLQCLFARLFGLHGWSVILPEALCSVGSVCVLYLIVKRQHGERAALLAAFFLAITPIFIAVGRTNNLDPSLTLVCLLAMLALMSAAEKGSLRLLCLSAALIGVGFNIKMLQAYMFLPAFYLVYFFAPEAKLRYARRVLHLAAATALLLAVSLSWCLIVDLTPAENRPYAGGSTTNSMLELAVGYNGILRALPIQSQALSKISGAIGMVPNEGGNGGLFRFFNLEMFGQASWLLPLSLFGLAALVNRLIHTERPEKRRTLRQLLLWGGLFIPMFAFFSVSEHLHRYYIVVFAPCLAALAAVAVTELSSWTAAEEGTEKTARHNLLPAGIAVTAAVQLAVLGIFYYHSVKPLIYIVIAAELLALLLYLLYRHLKRSRRALAFLTAALAVAGVSAAPLFWSYTPIANGVSAVMPSAGPKLISPPAASGRNGGFGSSWGSGGFAFGGNNSGFGNPRGNGGQPAGGKDDDDEFSNPWENDWFSGGGFSLIPQELIDYILAHDSGARYLISVPSATYATPIILGSGASVMTRGGFTGFDNALTLRQLVRLAESGGLQYYYVSDFTFNDTANYVRQNAVKVDPSEYSARPSFMRTGTLYDLSGLKTG